MWVPKRSHQRARFSLALPTLPPPLTPAIPSNAPMTAPVVMPMPVVDFGSCTGCVLGAGGLTWAGGDGACMSGGVAGAEIGRAEEAA